MFEIEYRIICNEDDDYNGQNGYLKLSFNDKTYGDMYAEELDGIMEQEHLSFWFHELCLVVIYLEKHEYVVLNDVDSNNIWIEFKRKNDDLIVSIINNEDKDGRKFIEFKIDNPKIHKAFWGNEHISYTEFKEKIILASREYINYLNLYNSSNEVIKKLEHDMDLIDSKILTKFPK
ncbi:MAG: hypothetical protein IJJ59_02165 [Pseudobutyrivibrio sp.]|uniref:hypothetical protein n=1 Tax=Pseudobutyrivibrio sp. TaxID=2014367 RepID=UPI0025F83451|nr:hypothetical protein [Pseudobutyrivibrio sp.]MBQ6462111.1 hypothetical protein [Pseudobutyrivibrio sp.]